MKKLLAIVAIAITMVNCNTPRPATSPTGVDSTSGTMGTSGNTGTTDTTRQLP